MRRTYVVNGVVQGVGFRWFALREAQRIGLAGWVRNRADGRVESVADGTAAQLDEFEQSLRRGPRASSVTDVHALESFHELGPLTSFEIR